MTKSEMVTRIHEALESKVSKKDAEKALEAIFSALKEEFTAGHDVSVTGFGTFKVKMRAARECRNPKNGAPLHVEAQKTVTFKPVSKLKEELNK